MVLVEGERIAAVGTQLAIPPGAKQIDLLQRVGFVMKGGIVYRDELARPRNGYNPAR